MSLCLFSQANGKRKCALITHSYCALKRQTKGGIVLGPEVQ